jgi:hypothetical protein
LRSTSYGTPLRCRIATVVTALCLWIRFRVICVSQ